ncbi:MAG: DUF3021 domain-containing protein [Oscillospiraceae bacterium]|nr:DUF3021 domain-containing protein [Oscillospiraceae bacterium]MBP1577613.1 DUF3021 domain-containing protein [Oscillospiraceae bacterium]
MKENLFNYIIKLAVIGLAIGWVTTTICLWCFNGADDTIKQMTCWLFCSIIFGVSTMVYDKLELIPATVIHFLITITVASANSYLLGYADSFFGTVITILPSFIAIYAAIYITVMLIDKANAKNLTEKLQNR